MEKFYFTFGSSSQFPYHGGYLIVKADDRNDAIEKYRKKYPDVNENTVNCAFIYSEKEWNNFLEWCEYLSIGRETCHEVIE